MSEETLQRPLPHKAVVTKPITQPFQLERPELETAKTAEELIDIIPRMGAEPAPPRKPKPVEVEEQYEPSERAVLSTTTTDQTYRIQTSNPKQILLIAETQDHFVEFNIPTDASSTKIFAKGSLSMTGKGITEIHAKTVTGTGTLYIRIWAA